jgi:hypothetical protein
MIAKVHLSGHTWIPGLTISTHAIPWDIFDQVLQGALVARLLTFAQ